MFAAQYNLFYCPGNGATTQNKKEGSGPTVDARGGQRIEASSSAVNSIMVEPCLQQKLHDVLHVDAHATDNYSYRLPPCIFKDPAAPLSLLNSSPAR